MCMHMHMYLLDDVYSVYDMSYISLYYMKHIIYVTYLLRNKQKDTDHNFYEIREFLHLESFSTLKFILPWFIFPLVLRIIFIPTGHLSTCLRKLS